MTHFISEPLNNQHPNYITNLIYKKYKLLEKLELVFLDELIFQSRYFVDLPLKIIAITITTTTTIKIPTPTPVLNISPMARQLLKKIEMKARIEYDRYFFIFRFLVF